MSTFKWFKYRIFTTSWHLVFHSQDVKLSAWHSILLSVTQGPLISFLLVALRQYLQIIMEGNAFRLFYTTFGYTFGLLGKEKNPRCKLHFFLMIQHMHMHFTETLHFLLCTNHVFKTHWCIYFVQLTL